MDAVQPTLATPLNTEWEWLCAGSAERVRTCVVAGVSVEGDGPPAEALAGGQLHRGYDSRMIFTVCTLPQLQ